MKSPIPAREIEIGKRLRAFREGKQIPRTSFALSIGIGGERLASYESGRVPLRFGVFRAVSERYLLSAAWLATGEGSQTVIHPYDFSSPGRSIGQRRKFSEAYKTFTEGYSADLMAEARHSVGRITYFLQRLRTFFEENPDAKPPQVEAQQIIHLANTFETVILQLPECPAGAESPPKQTAQEPSPAHGRKANRPRKKRVPIFRQMAEPTRPTQN